MLTSVLSKTDYKTPKTYHRSKLARKLFCALTLLDSHHFIQTITLILSPDGILLLTNYDETVAETEGHLERLEHQLKLQSGKNLTKLSTCREGKTCQNLTHAAGANRKYD